MLREGNIFRTIKATMIMGSDYLNNHINLVFLYALRTQNYCTEKMLIKSYNIVTDLHKRHLFFCRTDFVMKRGRSACATTSLNAVKIACKLVMLRILARPLGN